MEVYIVLVPATLLIQPALYYRLSENKYHCLDGNKAHLMQERLNQR